MSLQKHSFLPHLLSLHYHKYSPFQELPWQQGQKRRSVWDPITKQLVFREKYKKEK